MSEGTHTCWRGRDRRPSLEGGREGGFGAGRCRGCVRRDAPCRGARGALRSGSSRGAGLLRCRGRLAAADLRPQMIISKSACDHVQTVC